jgi:predicted nicotinamide N-methyase
MKSCEVIDFGPLSGHKNILQFSGEAFHRACLQVNSKTSDNTGYRIHPGAHVATRFLLKHPDLIHDLKVCELGCGTGVYGLISTCGGSITSHLSLTDGNPETVNIASQNVQELASSLDSSKISTSQLLWGSDDSINELIESVTKHFKTNALTSGEVQKSENSVHSSSGSSQLYFDVVIGCELFYYRTNVEELLHTVLKLTNSSGIFVHSHVFRRCGQDTEMIKFLADYGWVTLEVPVQRFIDSKELDEHPEWFNVHCLVSGPVEKVNELLKLKSNISCEETQDQVQSSELSSSVAEDIQSKNSGIAFPWRIFCGTAEETENAATEGIIASQNGEDNFLFANFLT